MANKTYVLDTNMVSGLRPNRNPHLWAQVNAHQGDRLCICEPVIFEVERGLHQRGASVQLKTFREQLLPMFAIPAPTLIDWRVAAQLWGNARSRGIQFSDVDVLLAAITLRLGGVLVTDDSDFAHLPLVPKENWLHP